MLSTTQLAGLLTANALAVYMGLNEMSAASYQEMKKVILHHYDINDETWTDQKSPEESELGRLPHRPFHLLDQDQKMSPEELMVPDQFLGSVPEDLRE